jgi:plastocyanin
MKQHIQCALLVSAAILASTGGLRAGVISGTVNPGKAGSVVYVDAVPGKTFPAPAKPVVMDQKSLLFQPHVLAVQDNIFWPAVSGNKKLSHNMGTWPTGEEREFKFDTVGVVPLLCNVHPEMSAYIIVSPTPYYAVTDASGNFKIADVPDGSYTVSAWHEGMKILSKPVTLSGNATVEFTLAK